MTSGGRESVWGLTYDTEHIVMTPSAVCARRDALSMSRFTGKERDTESGNDYFGGWSMWNGGW